MSRNTKGLATQLPYQQTGASELLIAIPGLKPHDSLQSQLRWAVRKPGGWIAAAFESGLLRMCTVNSLLLMFSSLPVSQLLETADENRVTS